MAQKYVIQVINFLIYVYLYSYIKHFYLITLLPNICIHEDTNNSNFESNRNKI